MPSLIDITERTTYTGAKVDRENSIVFGVAVLKSRSPSRKRTYPDDTLKSAITLIEGASVYLDHPEDSAINKVRSVRDLAGQLKTVRFVEGQGLFGDLHVMPNHPWIIDVAERMPEVMGHSINGKGEVKMSSGGEEIVESIEMIRSVDLVTAPGTVASLFESKDIKETPKGGEEKMDWTQVTVESLLENRLDLVETIRNGVKENANTAKILVDLQEQAKTLKTENDELKTKEALREKTTKVDKLITESKLPKEATTEVFRQQLIDAEDEDAMKVLIEDRKTLVEGTKKPASAGRTDLKESSKIEDEDLIAIVQG